MIISPKNRYVNPLAAKALEQMKYETAEELGYLQHQEGKNPANEYQNTLNKRKYEVAEDLGIPFDRHYNGEMTTRDAGRVGGQLGGHIGGNMVRKMIAYAENQLATEYEKNH